MEITFPFTTIGDPHLGKVFKTGVPLHRRGDREEMVWKDFSDRLHNSPHNFIFCVGDLFDEFVVPPEVVLRTQEILESATNHNNDLIIVILQGNHDGSRDANKKSSFEVLRRLCKDLDNVHFAVGDKPLMFDPVEGIPYAFYGWHPFVSAAEVANNYLPPHITTVFGHWDLTQHGQDSHNLIPLEQLRERGIKQIYTGHNHRAEHIVYADGTEVFNVGSMQPYAHGEQEEGDTLYLTLRPEQVEEGLRIDPEAFAMSNVRVLLHDGETYVNQFNCLSMTFKRTLKGIEVAEDDTLPDAAYDNFNFEHLSAHCFNKNNVDVEMREQILTSIREKNFHD